MMELYEGQLKNYEWKITTKRNHHKGKKSKSYCENIICFDTESTSAFITNDNEVILYEEGHTDEYWNSLTAISICYIWMCGIEDTVYYGREPSSFLNMLEDMPKDAEVTIYVHNLSYDWCSCLLNILDFDNVFARSPHKPIYAASVQYPNITFKCSYALTNLSLESWGKMIGVKKKAGDLNYNIMRSPIYPIEEEPLEMGYCEADIRVMIAGIRKYVERFGSLKEIPMTKTGIVRKKTKEILCNPYYVKCIKRLVPKSADEYKMLQDCFAGGYTHANRWFTGQTIRASEEEYIGHRDFASSYPTWIVCGKMPCSPWVITGDELPDPNTFEEEAYIIKLELWDIESITFNTFIQGSKCTELEEAVWDNGRIIKAKHLCITCIELDYDIILRTYKIGKKRSRCTYRSHKDYLPDDFRALTLELYEAKTKWKKVEGFEDIYMNSKSDINSLFGMAVSSLLYSEVIFDLDADDWYVLPITKEKVDEKLENLKKYNPRDKRYFLNYSWGIYIAGLGRHALWECILSLDTPAGKNNCLYCDTDSIFYTDYQDFSWYDDMIDKKLREACDEGGLDYNKTRPSDKWGNIYPLGHFVEEDETITEFKTLGAKRYVTRLADDNKLHLTVAGINKGAVECLNDDIENFKDGVIFDKDHSSVHKLLHTYNTNQPEVILPDGYVLKQKYGVNLRKTGYTLEIPTDYKRVVRFLDMSIDDLSEQQFINLMGFFSNLGVDDEEQTEGL